MTLRKTPYPKKPPSQSRTPAFYWRGGDILREREYLADEYTKALVEFRRTEMDLQMVESELRQANETLHEREGYTTALANYLDADTEGNHTEQEYKRQLMKLEADIKKAEVELRQVKAVHHPAVASLLQKEKAYLLIEAQRTQTAVQLTIEQDTNDKRKLGNISVSQKYQISLDLETKILDLHRKYQFLRATVNKYKKEFDNTRAFPVSQSNDARSQRAAYGNLVDTNYSLLRAQEKTRRRPVKWAEQIDRLILEIEDLNDQMEAFGMPSEALANIEELRAKYGTSEELEETEKTEDAPADGELGDVLQDGADDLAQGVEQDDQNES
jgi:hypothetical protein